MQAARISGSLDEGLNSSLSSVQRDDTDSEISPFAALVDERSPADMYMVAADLRPAGATYPRCIPQRAFDL